MSEKEIKDVTVEEAKAKEPFKYGTSPILTINMIRENRMFRFEMPIGAHLDECEEACEECINVVKIMKEQAKKKMENEELAIERRAEASKDKTADLLNLVRAVQEMEGVDINQLEQMIRMATQVQQTQEQADEEKSKSNDEDSSKEAKKKEN